MSDNGIVWEDQSSPATAPPTAPATSNGIQWETSPGGDVAATPEAAVDPRAKFGQDVINTAGEALGRVGKNILALPEALDPRPQNTLEKVGAFIGAPAPLTRMVSGVLSSAYGVTQAPAAIHDIMQSEDPGKYIHDAATGAAGDALTGALLEGVSRGAGKVGGELLENPKATVQAATETAKSAGHAMLPDAAKQVLKFNERLQALKAKGVLTAPEDIAEATKAKLQPTSQTADVQQKYSAAKKAPGLRGYNGAAKPVPQEPGLMGNDALPPAPAPAPAAVSPEVSPSPAGETAASSATPAPTPVDDTKLYERARTELGPEAKISQVAKRAQDLHEQAQTFEQTFGQPLANFQDASGKFNMQDFVADVVKPGTAPVPQTISKVFGADGVSLIQDISGEPIHKWESTAPAGEPQGGTARLKAKIKALAKDETGSAGMPGTVNYDAPQVPKGGEAKMVSGSPDQYLKMIGADAKSILKTPADVEKLTKYREMVANGKPFDTPPEIHMDENNNLIGGDGRHRALAHLLEGSKKIKVKVVKHAFEKTH